MTDLHSNAADELFAAILTLKSIDECYKFFEDICTIKEVKEIAQRLEVAMLLDEGKVYNEVAKETGASTATISRVNKCLSYGTGGYQLILDRLKNNEQEGERD